MLTGDVKFDEKTLVRDIIRNVAIRSNDTCITAEAMWAHITGTSATCSSMGA